jgi:hypothetical protein
MRHAGIVRRKGRSFKRELAVLHRLALALAIAVVSSAARTAPPRLDLRLGFAADGSASPEWRAAVETHTGSRPTWEVHPLSDAEAAWLELVRARRDAWEKRIDALCVPFEGVRPPRTLAVVVGNQNGEDGFGLGEDAIYFDLSALARIYGAAGESGNAARLDRFFDHETTHVLHWRWERRHPQPVGTPLERALWAMAREGLGNLRSLSETWVGPRGELTPLARETLTELEPILVERLEKLAQATTEQESALTAGLSSGPFRRKWGALPVALWLAEESRGDDRALRSFVSSDSAGVLALARRHLAPALAQRLPRLENGNG